MRYLTIPTLALVLIGCGGSASREPRVTTGLRHTCALAADSTAYCWGENSAGQLGDGTRTDRAIPARVQGDQRFVRLSAGASHTCGLTETGDAYCWGWNNRGQLGDGTDVTRESPTLVAGNRKFVGISAGQTHTCAITASGRGACWGNNDDGQLGDGSRQAADSTWAERRGPRPVPTGESFTQIAAGARHTCAVTRSARLLCWGSNGSAQLGNGTWGNKTNDPTPVEANAGFVGVTAGILHTCATTLLGNLYCWGNDGWGQLGAPGRSQPRPAIVDSLARFKGVVALGNRTCGISGGAVLCWGQNQDGALGIQQTDTTAERITTPTPVRLGEISIAAIGPGLSQHICGTTADGGVACWGSNEDGQIDPSGETRTRPVLIDLGNE